MVLNPTLPSLLNCKIPSISKITLEGEEPDDQVMPVREWNQKHEESLLRSSASDGIVDIPQASPHKRSPTRGAMKPSAPRISTSVEDHEFIPSAFGTPTRLIDPYFDAPPIPIRARAFASPALRYRIEKLSMNIVTSTASPTKQPDSPTLGNANTNTIKSRMVQLTARRDAANDVACVEPIQIPKYSPGGFQSKLQSFQQLAAGLPANSLIIRVQHKRQRSAHRLCSRGHVQNKVNQWQQNAYRRKAPMSPPMNVSSSHESMHTWTTDSITSPPNSPMDIQMEKSFSKKFSNTSLSTYTTENLGSLMLSLSPEWESDDEADTQTPVIPGFNMDIFGEITESMRESETVMSLPPLPVIARTESMRLEDELYDDDCYESDLESEDEDRLIQMEITGISLPPVYMSQVLLFLLPQSFQESVEYIICGSIEFDLYSDEPTQVGSCAFYGIERGESNHWFKISRKSIGSRKIDRISKLQWDGEVRGVYTQIYSREGLLDPCCAYKRVRKNRNAIQKSLDRSRVTSPDGHRILETVSISL